MTKYIIGIDEVGRGALAGPVVVAAALVKDVIPAKAGTRIYKLGRLRDSKKLSSKQREAWEVYFKGHPDVDFAIARVYPRGIERMNVSRAANLAAARAFQMLAARHPEILHSCGVFLDGGLFLGNGKQIFPAVTVVKGDEKFPAIAAASIMAKVARDRLMVRLAKKYPAYGFDLHKGYGTAKHRAAIGKHGASRAHRSTFLKRLKTPWRNRRLEQF